MKKTIVGVALAAVLGTTPMLASAGYQDFNSDIYTYLTNGSFSDFVDLVEVGGYDVKFNAPDSQSNGDICPQDGEKYTVFAPVTGITDWVDVLEATLDKTWVQILATPGIAKAIVDDHVVNRSISASDMDDPSTVLLVARSGYRINITSPGPRDINSNVSVDGRPVIGYQQLCNGWVYSIAAPFESTPKSVTVGSGPATPTETPVPATELPNTL